MKFDQYEYPIGRETSKKLNCFVGLANYMVLQKRKILVNA